MFVLWERDLPGKETFTSEMSIFSTFTSIFTLCSKVSVMMAVTFPDTGVFQNNRKSYDTSPHISTKTPSHQTLWASSSVADITESCGCRQDQLFLCLCTFRRPWKLCLCSRDFLPGQCKQSTLDSHISQNKGSTSR